MLRQAPTHAPAPSQGGAAPRLGGPAAPGARAGARPDPAAPTSSRSDQLSWRNAVLGPTSASPGKDTKGTPDGRQPPDLKGDPTPAKAGQSTGAAATGRGSPQLGPTSRGGGRGSAPAWGKSDPQEGPQPVGGDAPGQTASPDRSSWPSAFSSSRNQGRRGSGPAWGAPEGQLQAHYGLPVGGPSSGREAQIAPGWGGGEAGQQPTRAKLSDALKGSLQGPKAQGLGSAARQEAGREGGEKGSETAPKGSSSVEPPMPAGREMFVATVTCMMGHHVEVQLADGRVYRGIFHTVNDKAFGTLLTAWRALPLGPPLRPGHCQEEGIRGAFCSSLCLQLLTVTTALFLADVCLKMARLAKPGNQQPGAEKDAIPGASSPIPVLRMDSADIVRLTAKVIMRRGQLVGASWGHACCTEYFPGAARAA